MALFKARARALDMLGRQQIAGIPTAISELFKNAHDAYSTRAEADFYRPTQTFVLRDDGLGMTEVDFLERWLTLGTDSKLNSKFGLDAPPVDPKQETRPIMGEKGVGRLAIATLGPQVLVLTRAKRGKHLGDVVAAFINWEVFECPGLDLADIEIPLKSFRSIPTKDQIDALVKEAVDGIKTLSKKIEPDRLRARQPVKWARIAALQRNATHQKRYKAARKGWLAGEDVVFPAGTWWLRRECDGRAVSAPAAHRLTQEPHPRRRSLRLT